MAKYAYAPLSVDERKRKPHGAISDQERDDNLVNERMPMCVGVCVLLAIVFVLSRTGVTADPVTPNPNAITTPAASTTTTAATTSTTGVHSVDTSSSTRTHYDLSAPTPPTPPTPPTTTPPKTTTASKTAASTTAASTTATAAIATTNLPNPQEATTSCDCNDPANLDMGVIREKLFANTPPHIIECSEASANSDQSACHLPPKDRFAALNQKGATLWMTGCSGAGKTTIATALEDKLVKHYGKHTYRLDGDNLRTGLNRDLSFSEADRAESVRRTGEIATLFADAGVITLVGLISPYRADRDSVRKRHEEQGIPFYEIFLDVPVDELKKRDPKGQYARVESGELKHFTCIDDPYEEPLYPEITLKTHELAIEE